MMKNMKRMLAMLLTLIIALGTCMTVLAEEAVEEPAPVEVEEPAPAPEPKPEPKAEAPKAEEPKVEETKVEEPKVEETKVEETKDAETTTEETKVEETKTEEEPAEETEDESAEEEPAEETEEEPAEEEATEETEEEAAEEEAAEEEELEEEEPETQTVHVSVVWNDNGNALGLRPGSVSVTLVGSNGTRVDGGVSPDEEGNWVSAFEDLPADEDFDAEGAELSNYEVDNNGLTVTYTCTAKAEEETEETEATEATEEELIDENAPAAIGSANIRTDADSMSAILVTVEDGAILTVLEVLGDWVKVDVDGVIGYVYKDEISGVTFEEPTEEEAAVAEPKVTIFSSRRAVMDPGETVYLTSKLENLDGYELSFQWQAKKNGSWVDVEGACSDSYAFEATADTLSWGWRLVVNYEEPQNEQ